MKGTFNRVEDEKKMIVKDVDAVDEGVDDVLALIRIGAVTGGQLLKEADDRIMISQAAGGTAEVVNGFGKATGHSGQIVQHDFGG